MIRYRKHSRWTTDRLERGTVERDEDRAALEMDRQDRLVERTGQGGMGWDGMRWADGMGCQNV